MNTILLTGSRNFTDEDLVHKALDAELAFQGSFMLVVGDCPTGADFFAQRWADAVRAKRLTATEAASCSAEGVGQGLVTTVRFNANGDKNGKAAGPIRNKRMVDFVKERDGKKLCLSFWKDGQLNAGTRNCVGLAIEAGIEIHRFHEPVGRW